MKYLWTLFCLTHCFAHIQQQPLIRTDSNPLDEKFAKYAQSIIDHYHVPSLSIAIIRNGTVYSDAYGIAVLPDTPAKPDTLYFVGSTTKSFTAAALSILMDDFRNTSSAFNWKTPVSTLIRDDFVLSDEYITTHATLEDLASHRTGFPRHDLSYGTHGLKAVRDTVRNMRNLPFTAGFREIFQYCNYMWGTLGYVLETLSGKPEAEFLRERIWSKIGMDSTYLTLDEAQAAAKSKGSQVARGYLWDAKTSRYYMEPYLDIGPLAGAGAMISTVLDYAEYLRMMLGRAPPIPAEGHTQLRRARSFEEPDINAPSNGPRAYALGWGITPYRGVSIIGHNGGLFGFGAQMAYVPELDWGIAMLANTALTSNLAEEVLMYALLDAQLNTPEHERFDHVKAGDKVLEKEAGKITNAREIVYGGKVPDPPLPASLPLAAYEGAYWSDGYKLLTFNISLPNPRTPKLKDTSKPVLRANAMDRVWPAYIELEHVSGEFFVGWIASPKGEDGVVIEVPSSGFAAEFKVGADGKVKELGLAVEPSMGGEKIWFKRL